MYLKLSIALGYELVEMQCLTTLPDPAVIHPGALRN